MQSHELLQTLPMTCDMLSNLEEMSSITHDHEKNGKSCQIRVNSSACKCSLKLKRNVLTVGVGLDPGH